MSKFITNKENPTMLINLEQIVQVHKSNGSVEHNKNPYNIVFCRSYYPADYDYWYFSDESVRDATFETIKGQIEVVEV